MARGTRIEGREGRVLHRLANLLRLRHRGTELASRPPVVAETPAQPTQIDEKRVATYLAILSRGQVQGNTARWYAVSEYAAGGDQDAAEALRRHGIR